MKQTLFGIAALVLLSAPLAALGVAVNVNDKPVHFDQPPVLTDGRVMVPLRAVFERLGATVHYTPSTRKIDIWSRKSSVVVTINSTAASINGHAERLAHAPFLAGGRALVPLRFVSEALGANVTWHSGGLVAIHGTAPLGSIVPTNQAYYTPPTVNVPKIASVVVDTGTLPDHPVLFGQTMKITMTGTPGGRATFDINDHGGYSMTEGPRGTYTGIYTVHSTDVNQKSVVTAHLNLLNHPMASRNADETVAMMGTSATLPPSHGTTAYGVPGYAHGQKLIRSVVHNASGGTLLAGQILRVTMYGEPGGQATVDIGSHQALPMAEVTPGTYVATWQVPAGETDPHANITAHLTLPDGRTQAQLAPPAVGIGVPMP